MTPERIAELRVWALALITGPCTCHLAQRNCPWPEATPEIRADLLLLLDECEKTSAGENGDAIGNDASRRGGSTPSPGLSDADERALEELSGFANLYADSRMGPTLSRIVATLREAIEERAHLQHIIDCANTPLMADVLKERDEAQAEMSNMGNDLVAAPLDIADREAELTRWKPLIDAAMKPTPPDRPAFAGTENGQKVWEQKVVRAALACRESTTVSREKDDIPGEKQ